MSSLVSLSVCFVHFQAIYTIIYFSGLVLCFCVGEWIVENWGVKSERESDKERELLGGDINM